MGLFGFRKKNEDASVHVNKGNTYFKQGNLDDAIKEYLKALKIAKDDSTYYNLGNAYQASGQFNLAISTYEEALKLSPRFTAALNNLGLAYTKLGKYENAIDCYQRFINLAQSEEGAGHAFHVGRVEELIRQLKSKM